MKGGIDAKQLVKVSPTLLILHHSWWCSKAFLGTSLREGYRRLYLTDALDYCIEFKQDDEEARSIDTEGRVWSGTRFHEGVDQTRKPQ